jgi:cytochrome c oxidase cbb3-type subunit I
MDSALLSLLGAFVLSLIGLFAFIWTLRQGLLVENPRAASVIFAPGEIGHIDDPALPASDQGAMQSAVRPRGDPVVPADRTEHADRIAADRSTAFPVFVFLAFACMWLLVGSVAGLVASIKLHHPDWLVDDAWLTFGRIRTVHLNAVIYGWSTNGALGIIVWLLPRLLRTPLYGRCSAAR